MRFCLVTAALILTLATGSAFAQGKVTGKVTDIDTGDPLPGVYVIYGKNSGTVTDNKGIYSFSADTGRIILAFQFIGYRTATRNVSLSNGDDIMIDIAMQTETHEIDQVVVSADRMEHKVSELTVSIDVIKSDFIARNHLTDAQELINKTSGIEVLDGQASIRGGSGFSYGVGSRVLALVDGLPMMAADGGNIKWNFLPVENLAQVEIIKGASSVLYGSSALNGIINFRTADASNIPITKFFIEAGIFGKPSNKEWIWWNTPRVYSSASFSHLRKAGRNDLGIGINLLTDNSYRKYNDEKLGRLNLRFKHHSRTDGLSYGFNINTGRTRKTDFLLWEDAERGALVQDTSSVSGLYSNYFSIDPFISMSKNSSARHDLKTRIQYSENIFPVRKQNDAQAFSVYGEYQLWHKLTSFMDITSGLSGYYSVITSMFFGDHDGRNIAGFSQFEIRPFERLKAVAGIRLEQNSLDGINDRIVPVFRAGINYQAAGFTFLRASFGQGYRYPSIAEKHAATTLGSVRIFPNPYVGSESGWSSEIGIKQGISIGNLKGQADLSLFYSRYDDMIEYIFGLYPGGLGFQATNIEQARIVGAEIETGVSGEFGNVKTNFSAGYTYIYPVEYNSYEKKYTDIYLKYRRKHSLKTSLSTEYKRFDFGLVIYMRSKILNIDDVFLNPLSREMILPGFYDYWGKHNNGYFLADGNIGFSVTEGLDISIVVKNITNTEYMGRPGDIQPHRNYSIRLSGRF